MIQNNFSDGYKKALINAEARIKGIGFSELSQEDIFIEIVLHCTGSIKELLDLYGINEKLILEIIGKGLFNKKPDSRKGKYAGMNPELKDVILGSVKNAAEYKKSKASLEDFLLSMLRSGKWLPKVLDFIGINASDLEINLIELEKTGIVDGSNTGKKEVNSQDNSMGQIIGALTENLLGGLGGMAGATPFDMNKKPKNKKEAPTDTPTLDFYSEDLTEEAKEGKIDNIIGRDAEIERLIAILNRKTKNNPVLLGEPGVGKTAIVEGLALRIKQGKVPFSMKDKRILAIDINSMVAGTKYRGEFEQRIKSVIEEASKIENEVILFIDEIHTIIGAGSGEGSLDASNILKPAMGRGKIKVIGATTLNEYQKYIEKDAALERRFQRVVADEPNKETANKIVLGIKETFEEYHNLNISDEACLESVNLSSRYITDRFLPDKAIDLIDEACSLKSMQYNFDEKEIKALKSKMVGIQTKIDAAVIAQKYKHASDLKAKKTQIEEKVTSIKQKFSIPKSKRMTIGIKDIQKVLSMSTGIPTENLSKKEVDKLKKLPKTIRKSIIGQDDAIEGITRAIMRSRAGIGDQNRPLGSFLFLGPTGVGKTELIKVLAKEFYNDDNALIKIDMSEYNDKTSINKLIGASAGYVGYEEGGMLTEKIRKKPYSIVLFDEIEKADFEVYNILLQILEDGVLTDNKGRKINFKNTILVMTSNIGAEEFSDKAEKIGFNVTQDEEKEIMDSFDQAKTNIKNNLTDYFAPEFINRIDKIIVFNPLNKKDIKKIVTLHLKKISNRLIEKDIALEYDIKVVNHIAKEVYNPEFGAREVRRYVADNIEDVIAEDIINENVSDKVALRIEKSKIVFEY